jgi:surfactin synthase thioesterase subunit/acyl carrier protein
MPDGAASRRALVVDLMRREVMRELGFEETIDSRQPLNELGLDSLMAVNLANQLEVSLDVPVPIVQLIRGPSIEQLVDDLFPELAGGPSSATRAAGPTANVTADGITASARVGNAWLVIPRPNRAARLRLFCFPFAGGGAATYRPWADLLPAHVELVAIEPPGRASRIDEPAIPRFDPFVTALADAMRPYLDRPSAFFGHCWGGLTAYETAQRLLRDDGLDCVHLFVSGSRPPHRLSSEGLFEQNLLESLLARDDFDPLRPLHVQSDDVFAEAIRHFNIGATTEFLARPELRRLLLPAVRADFEMATSYRFEPAAPWDIPITAFAGLQDPYAAREDAAAWNEYTRRSFRLHLRAGAHFLIVEDRDFIVDAIGRELTA